MPRRVSLRGDVMPPRRLSSGVIPVPRLLRVAVVALGRSSGFGGCFGSDIIHFLLWF